MKKRKRKKGRNRRVSGGKAPDLVEAGKATRFRPGTSGNPLGRPATKLLRQFARELAEEIDPRKRKQRAWLWVEALAQKAAKGNLGHFEMLLRLLEEDAGVDLRVGGPGGGSIPVAHKSAEPEFIAAIRHMYGLVDPPEEVRKPPSGT